MNARIVMAMVATVVAVGMAQTGMAQQPPPPPPGMAQPPPPPPPGRVLRPGMQWCSRCGGDGTHGHYWWGGRKPCRYCDGSGMVVMSVPPPAPPAPVHVAPKHQPPHGGMKGAPKGGHDGGMKGAPKGGHGGGMKGAPQGAPKGGMKGGQNGGSPKGGHQDGGPKGGPKGGPR